MPLNLLWFQSFLQAVKVLIDFLIVWVLIYYILKVVRNNSRTVQIFKGVVVIILVRFVALYLGLSTVQALADFAIQYGFIVFVVIFQPEIRGLLERLGKTSVFSSINTLTGNERERLVNDLVNAAVTLSRRKTGGLITLEQGHSLVDYIKTGTPINATVTEDLLTSIFVTTTPLHDGAVIIKGDRVACASAYFPPTARELSSRYGARHRAALGISEITDSITIVISEETGTISIAEGGKLTEVDEFSLRDYLNSVIKNTEKEVSEKIDTRISRRINFGRLNVDPIRVERVDGEEIPQLKKQKEKKEQTEKTKEGFVGSFKKRREMKKEKREELKESGKKVYKKDRSDSKPEPKDGRVNLEDIKSATRINDDAGSENRAETHSDQRDGGESDE